MNLKSYSLVDLIDSYLINLKKLEFYNFIKKLPIYYTYIEYRYWRYLMLSNYYGIYLYSHFIKTEFLQR